jgi:hypothetical protein
MDNTVRILLNGEDCSGELVEEKDSFLFLLGVRLEPWGRHFIVTFSGFLDVLTSAGPSRFRTGEVMSLNA